MKVAVVILNWNGVEMLRQFLPSVVEHSSDLADVWVADNGSSDCSVEMLRAEFHMVKLVLFDQNYGFAEGYNLAIEQIQAEYIVLLNSDVQVTKEWLTPLVSYLDAHPKVAACQPTIRSYHDPASFEYAGASGGFIDGYGYPFCRGRILGTVEKDLGQYAEVMPIFWATGAALFIRREKYLEVGGLDPRFFAHMEEIDLCWRLRSRGEGVVCIPNSVVYHVGGGTLNKENPRKTFLNFRNNLIMIYKNLPSDELKRVMFVRFFLDYLAIIVFLVKGDFKNAQAVLSARTEYKKLKPTFEEARTINLKKSSVNRVPERMEICILWQYYIKGRKLFSQLLYSNHK